MLGRRTTRRLGARDRREQAGGAKDKKRWEDGRTQADHGGLWDRGKGLCCRNAFTPSTLEGFDRSASSAAAHSTRSDKSASLPHPAMTPLEPARRKPDLFATFVGVITLGAVAGQLALIIWLGTH